MLYSAKLKCYSKCYSERAENTKNIVTVLEQVSLAPERARCSNSDVIKFLYINIST